MRLPTLVPLLLVVTGPTLAAQELFTRNALEHVPDTTLISPIIADFDGDGDLDVYGSGTLLTNFLGRFVESGPYGAWNTHLGAHDFDGDGKLDLLDNTSSGLASVGVSFNRLPLPFQRRTLGLTGGARVRGHAVADFDQDGDLDIILASGMFSAPVQQLVNDGTGAFTNVTTARMPPSGLRVEGVDPIDFDGDGDLDLVVSDYANGPRSLGIMINQGGGVFSAPDTTLVQSVAWEVLHIVDLDGDGDQDILANGGRLIENLGGTFVDAAVQPIFLTAALNLVCSGDIDGDGDLDLFASYDAFLSGWFENVGAGLPFVDRRQSGAMVRWWSHTAMEITDVDGDGHLDVVSARDRVRLLLGQPSGDFVDLTPERQFAHHYGDYNGDGYLDAVFGFGGYEFSIRRGDGVGGFVESRTAPGVGVVRVLNQADVDMDGDLDLLYWARVTNSHPGILLNDGAGNFSQRANTVLTHVGQVTWARFADLDGDGDPDLMVQHGSGRTNRITELLFNDGTGGFLADPARQIPPFLGQDAVAEVLDADGDGDLDLVLAYDDPVLYRNDGSGSFSADLAAIPARFPSVGDRSSALSIADVDGDGDLDFLALHSLLNNPLGAIKDAVIYENTGAGVFSVRTVINEAATWIDAVFADVDLDGDQDLLISSSEIIAWRTVRKAEILENDGTGVLARGTKTLDGLEALPDFIQDLDGDGDIDLDLFVNNTAQIRARFVSRLGGELNLQIANPSLSATQWAYALISAGRLARPIRLPTFGQLALDPALGFSLQALSRRGGPVEFDVPIPNIASLAGVKLYAQGLMINQRRLTNAITVTLAR